MPQFPDAAPNYNVKSNPVQEYPCQDSDFETWGKMDSWSIEEGICLLLGQIPEKSIWERDHKKHIFSHNALLRTEFEKYLKIALRSIATSAITKRQPSDFLSWAKQKELTIPDKLQAAVDKYKTNWIDWQKEAERFEKLYEAEKVKNETLGHNQKVASSKTSNKSDIISSKSKTLYYWLLGVALHRSWKDSFISEDKGNALASRIVSHAVSSKIKIKAEPQAIANLIVATRDACGIEMLEEAAQSIEIEPV